MNTPEARAQKELARLLKALARRSGWTITALSERSGVPRSTTDKYLRTPPYRPSPEIVQRLLSALEPGEGERAQIEELFTRVTGRRLGAAEQPEVSEPPAAARMVVGRPLAEVEGPEGLEIHPAISAPGAGGELPELTPYLPREHDRQLRDRLVEAVTRRCSVLVMLVAGSSTGKTRACWEALHLAHPDGGQLLEGWRLWTPPRDPGDPEAMIRELDQVGPGTVIWLNEAQRYLLTPGTIRGEQVAATLRSLLEDPQRAPVIVLGTIWPDFFDALTTSSSDTRPDPGARAAEPYPQARALLAGTHLRVPGVFDPGTIERLQNEPGTDPRLREAAQRCADGELAQYLAGAPALLQRYETADPALAGLLEAAMDLRRLGHGLLLPDRLLEALTPHYLTDNQWHTLQQTAGSTGWFTGVLERAQQGFRNVARPLTRLHPRPGEPAIDGPVYQLADYLDQIGRIRRRRAIVPPGFWSVVAEHVTDPTDARALADAAYDRLHYQYARRLYPRADPTNDTVAARSWMLAMLETGNEVDNHTLYSSRIFGPFTWPRALTDLLTVRRDVATLEMHTHPIDFHLDGANSFGAASQLARVQVIGGATVVDICAAGLGGWLSVPGDVEGLRERADRDGYAAKELAGLLRARGDVEGLRERAAHDGYAAKELAGLLGARGDVEGLRERADRDGYAARELAGLLWARGDVEGLRERADRDGYAAGRLAWLLGVRGDVEGLRERADRDDDAACRQILNSDPQAFREC